jgi:hypothetical protein
MMVSCRNKRDDTGSEADRKGQLKKLSTYIVDHNGLLAKGVKSHCGIDRTPVKFDRASNTVDTATKHNRAMVVESNIV